MAKKKESQKITPQSLIMGIIGAIILAIASYFGIELGQPAEAPPAPTVDVGAQLTQVASLPQGSAQAINLAEGFGAARSFWQVYFTAPSVNDAEPSETCRGGVDEVIVEAVNGVQNTLDIAAFEWLNDCLTDAVVAAHERGVVVRMVVDDEHTVEENEERVLLGEEAPFQRIIDAEIPYRDDARSALMHNKFFILDGTTVFTGSMNYTARGTYANNNNVLQLRSQRAVQVYQAEFAQMFTDGIFGPQGAPPRDVQFTQDGIPVRILFSPNDDIAAVLVEELSAAQSEIRFMSFSFTLDEAGAVVLERAQAGVNVSGIFETTGSETQYSELAALSCAGLDVYQDGNSETFHHKAFIIDRTTVITGSFNFSESAASNDENIVIIRDPALAEQYIAEFNRQRRIAHQPDGLRCN